MHRYPIYLSLVDAAVAVVGAGTVGRRKIASLSKAGAAAIFVFDPSLTKAEAVFLEKTPGVKACARGVLESDLEGKRLVFAASSDSEENARVAALCEERGVLCNVADSPERSSFIVPALAEANGIMAAFSTGGNSPALARRIREDAPAWLEAAYGPLAIFMGRVRPLVLALGLSGDENARIFRSLAYSRLGDLLAGGDTEAAANLTVELLPPSLRGRIEELFDGLG